MLVAVAKEGNMVCSHFGHCEEFALYDTDSGQYRFIDNPGHVPGFLPGFLKQHGVQVVIAGGMGGRAQELFAEKGIQTIVGVSGTIGDVLEKFKKGELVSTGEVCSRHEHAGGCHE
ncbi:MAG: NifB/NifX family molybdenum-iron cluster-binding protein [Syntrophomonadaceae bacterium]|nr:NifB/NifX family molybdenum-iron cluster-binding protein [Syntrophomonadaceae bacterium]